MVATGRLLLWTVLVIFHQESLLLTLAWSFGQPVNNKPKKAAIGPLNPRVRLLILPGFGNDSSDYLLPGSLVENLQKRGWSSHQIRVLPVHRLDWLQVFALGALDVQFWQGTAAPTRPAYKWYLTRVAQQIKDLTRENNDKVVLICHSAGGWLARAALGFGSDEPNEIYGVDLKKLLGVVTLGSPHAPPPIEVIDMTRGALRLTDETFPGAYHKDNLFYISVIGNALCGVQQIRSSPFEPTTQQGFAYNSYLAVCGDGLVMGDGVVPTCAAHIQEASHNIDLDGVFHSINVPEKWYGSDAVIDSWHDVMLAEIRRSSTTDVAMSKSKTQYTNPLERFFTSNL
jgi:pimeloyl-ACP methyl ester carboxylesterase